MGAPSLGRLVAPLRPQVAVPAEGLKSRDTEAMDQADPGAPGGSHEANRRMIRVPFFVPTRVDC